MATFQYIAKDAAGNETRGQIEAGDRNSAIVFPGIFTPRENQCKCQKTFPYHRCPPNRFHTVTHASLYSCLYATHQRNRAVLLLVVEEERTVGDAADQTLAPIGKIYPATSHDEQYHKLPLVW